MRGAAAAEQGAELRGAEPRSEVVGRRGRGRSKSGWRPQRCGEASPNAEPRPPRPPSPATAAPAVASAPRTARGRGRAGPARPFRPHPTPPLPLPTFLSPPAPPRRAPTLFPGGSAVRGGGRSGPGRGMALLDLALEGMAVFGFVLFLVLWLMHFMAIIYT